ncbi:ECF-type sigma factor [Dokdonella sp.]|uniref:ECF-type sigma factor n=1 Tax=Dokdonella sp. TaxID=2291710 RepID=UPI001B1A7238|nr:ECF-type sigma factor [Dokdonella sp.]MBO9662457.1 hypothetical protein [Dokdonella sp.]
MDADVGEITLLLRNSAGDDAARQRLAPLIYDTLRRLARGALAGDGRERTLGTTALVHEVYLKLLGGAELDWPDRRRFFAYAGRAMRSLAIDDARRRSALKRGGEGVRDDDALPQLVAPDASLDLVALGQVLDRLGAVDPRLGELVELHVFAGLAFPEVAQCLGVSLRTVMRDWQKARALCASLLEEPAA